MSRGILGRVAHGWRVYGVKAPGIALARGIERVGASFGFAVRRAWFRATTIGTIAPTARISPHVRITPGARVDLGAGCFIGPRVVLEVTASPSVHLRIGARTWISHDCHIQATASVDIGADCLVGELVSIRDTSHRWSDPDRPIREQGDVASPVEIGDDVWIGRGTVILGSREGTKIGSGAVIGANARVSGRVPPMSVTSAERTPTSNRRRA